MGNKAVLLGVALVLAVPAFADNPSTQKPVVTKPKTKPKSIMQQSNFSEGSTSATGKAFPGSGTNAAKAGKPSLTGISGSQAHSCRHSRAPLEP